MSEDVQTWSCGNPCAMPRYEGARLGEFVKLDDYRALESKLDAANKRIAELEAAKCKCGYGAHVTHWDERGEQLRKLQSRLREIQKLTDTVHIATDPVQCADIVWRIKSLLR